MVHGEDTAGIYAIEFAGGEVYVGCSGHVGRRWRQHELCLRARRHPNRGVQAAWDASGGNASFRVVEELPGAHVETLLQREAAVLLALAAEGKRLLNAEAPTAGALSLSPARSPRRPLGADTSPGRVLDPAALWRRSPAVTLVLDRASDAVAIWIERTFPDLRLTQAEAHVLAYLADHTSCSINDLHHSFGHRRSTLTTLLDRLEGRGWLQRAPHPTSRRLVLVELTGSGRPAADRVHAAVRELEARVAARAGGPVVGAFLHVIQALEEELQ